VQLGKALKIDLATKRADPEDQGAQVVKCRDRLDPRTPVGSKVQVAHEGKGVEERQVAKVQAKSDGVLTSRGQDHFFS
jgi:hypothetical protein